MATSLQLRVRGAKMVARRIARSASALSRVRLDELPEELLQHIGRNLLTDHLPSALRCRQACTLLRDHLAALVPEADARRLQWVAAMTVPNHEEPQQRNANAIELIQKSRKNALVYICPFCCHTVCINATLGSNSVYFVKEEYAW